MVKGMKNNREITQSTEGPGNQQAYFKRSLSRFRTSKRFYPRRSASELAGKLVAFLKDLRTTVQAPKTGISLLVAFYRTDEVIFNRCDDSDGLVGDVYRNDAQALFIHYAQQCSEKKWLIEQVLDLFGADNYGVRDVLMKCASNYLPNELLATVIDRIWLLAEETGDSCWFFALESLANQLGDPVLFEKVKLKHWPAGNAACCFEIARQYFRTGNYRGQTS